jgi:putative membrane protein
MIPPSFAASLLLAGMLGACDGQPRASIEADTIPTPITSPDLSDANIVALLDHANEADSSAGEFASRKATATEVKKFARMMMADHHRLRKRGADLARKLGVTAQAPADDPITPLARREMALLQATEKGLDFDRTYIEQEILVHGMLLDLVDEVHEAAGNAELEALIEQARPLIETHLEQAQAIATELEVTT